METKEGMLMEFHEKLQHLRRQAGLTQEELAQALYVSRTAVSKWESGRGYPSIDSLKHIARYFHVTIDQLLSGDEALTLAQEDQRQKLLRSRDLIFGLLDLSSAILLFAPFFAQRGEEPVRAVSLLALDGISPYLRAVFLAAVAATVLLGILTLALRRHTGHIWLRCKTAASLLLSTACGLVFTVSLQPYAAVFVFAFLTIKVIFRLKTP